MMEKPKAALSSSERAWCFHCHRFRCEDGTSVERFGQRPRDKEGTG